MPEKYVKWSPGEGLKRNVHDMYPRALTSEYWLVLPEFNLLETEENAYMADSGGC